MADVITPMYINNEMLYKVIHLMNKVRNYINQTQRHPKSLLVVEASVHLSSSFLFQMITKLMTKYRGWTRVGKWKEKMWCTFKDAEGNLCRSVLGPTYQTSSVRQIHPPLHIASDVSNVTSICLSAKETVSLDNKQSSGCVLPDDCTVEYSKLFETDRWKFTAAKHWTARTLKGALSGMDQTEPSMRFKIEIARPSTYFSTHTDGYIATSLLMKVACLFGEKCRMF